MRFHRRHGPLTPGNLAIVRLGDGTTALSGAAATTFIDEYTVTGTFVQTIAVPTAASGVNRALTMQGSSTAMGALNLSSDGRYLTFGGFDAAPGTASVGTTTSAAVNRVIARLDMSGNVDTTTAMNAAFSANQIRSVATTDGTNFWAAGGNSGVQYVPFGAVSGVNQISTGAPTNLRVLNVAMGNVYVSSASGTGTQGILQLGSGLQTTPAALATLPNFLSTIGGTGSFYDYYFANPNTAYVADDSAVAGLGGLQKWSFDGVDWIRDTTFAAPAGFRIRQMTGVTVAGVTTLYITGDNGSSANSSFFSFTEAAGFSGPLAAAGTNKAFRGIELIVPSPGALALIGVGGLIAGRRRRA
jgi:hypothetical protein